MPPARSVAFPDNRIPLLYSIRVWSGTPKNNIPVLPRPGKGVGELAGYICVDDEGEVGRTPALNDVNAVSYECGPSRRLDPNAK